MKEAETPKPARQEGAPHLDLAAPCLASPFLSTDRCDGEKGKRGAESDRDTQNPQPTAVYWLLFWPLYAPQ